MAKDCQLIIRKAAVNMTDHFPVLQDENLNENYENISGNV